MQESDSLFTVLFFQLSLTFIPISSIFRTPKSKPKTKLTPNLAGEQPRNNQIFSRGLFMWMESWILSRPIPSPKYQLQFFQSFQVRISSLASYFHIRQRDLKFASDKSSPCIPLPSLLNLLSTSYFLGFSKINCNFSIIYQNRIFFISLFDSLIQ